MESWPWKRDLGASADRLESAQLGLARTLVEVADDQDAFDAEVEALYQVERDLMAGAFATRRLIGMPTKVTKAARSTTAVVTQFPLRKGARAPDLWDVLGDLDMYEISTPTTQTVSANELCNLFVHSFVFRLAWTLEGRSWQDFWLIDEDDPQCEATPERVAGFLVATDKTAGRHLTMVSLEEVLRVFRIFATDEVAIVRGRRDSRGRMHVTAE